MDILTLVEVSLIRKFTNYRKKKAMLDWFIALFFKRDITRVKILTERIEAQSKDKKIVRIQY